MMRTPRPQRTHSSRRLGVLVVACSLGSWTMTIGQEGPQCQAAGPLVRIPELPEASGIAISRRSSGRLWAHNDSGEPVLVALDTRGKVTGRTRLSGVRLEDWEAVAVGSCPAGSCVYIGDIGDNQAKRKQITVHRIPEPAADGTVAVQDSFHATYPDAPHDAETLLVAPDGRLLIVTKGETDKIGLYRFPRDLRAGALHQLERVGEPSGSKQASAADRVTDGAVSADGASVVLRTKQSLAFYRAADFLNGKWLAASRVDLRSVGEAQGEGVAMAADGTVYLVGEGGGKSLGGTLARLTCSERERSPRPEPTRRRRTAP